MLRLIFLFLLLLGSVLIGVHFSDDPGLITIIFKDYTIQLTVWTGMVILGLSFILMHFLVNMSGWLVTLPKRWRRSLNRKRIRRARRRTQQGLIEFSEGYWQQARQNLIRAIPYNDKPLLNYLTAARAAQNMDDLRLRDDYLREAQHEIKDAKIAIALTQAELQLDAHQWEQALATLRHIQELTPKHPYVIKLLLHLYLEVRDWQQLIDLLPKAKKLNVITSNEFNELNTKAWRDIISDMAKTASPKTMADLINALPKELKYDVIIHACYIQYLFSHQEQEQAEQCLRRILVKNYHDSLVLLYRKAKPLDKTLDFLESLLKQHQGSVALQLVLADMCAKLHFWGKAREYLEQATVHVSDDPALCLIAGELYEQLQEQTEALAQYRRAMLLINKP